MVYKVRHIPLKILQSQLDEIKSLFNEIVTYRPSINTQRLLRDLIAYRIGLGKKPHLKLVLKWIDHNRFPYGYYEQTAIRRIAASNGYYEKYAERIHSKLPAFPFSLTAIASSEQIGWMERFMKTSLVHQTVPHGDHQMQDLREAFICNFKNIGDIVNRNPCPTLSVKNRIDKILCDFMLGIPSSPSGKPYIKYIIEDTPHTPIVIVTKTSDKSPPLDIMTGFKLVADVVCAIVQLETVSPMSEDDAFKALYEDLQKLLEGMEDEIKLFNDPKKRTIIAVHAFKGTATVFEMKPNSKKPRFLKVQDLYQSIMKDL